MNRVAGAIRTPDQRLRVFVSSTLRELAPERRVVRGVIERLALAPVMFELGARPHPPRALYRAYLEQSDIFIGIYWESYGWIAPGEEISGLEDEYDLAPDVPMLIYVKRSETRQERLNGLLDRIRDDDRASYASFENEKELAALVTSDLATLLAERFDDARRAPGTSELPSESSLGVISLAAPLTRLIGRDEELRRCVELLTQGSHRLVTLTGPGGVGKTRLAVAAAREVESSFPDGVAFVDLAPIRDAALVVSSIATALGVRDAGDVPLRARLMSALDHRRILLVLDNMEQVVDAGADVRALLEGTAVTVLATSRVLLRLDGEQAVPVRGLPPVAAIALFVERAQGVKPDFELTEHNSQDVAAVVTSLDCLPLAVELAAARVRVLPPGAMVHRLDQALGLLVRGARDHPERQQTLRATIQWSADLLPAEARELLLRLGVFRSSFAFDCVEWIARDMASGEAIDLLEALVDSSLVQELGSSSTTFTMLATVREYAVEELRQRGDLEGCQQRHADFYADLAVRAEPELVSANQSVWIERLRNEFEDLRAAIEYNLHARRADAVAQIVWPLYWFWWVSGRVADVSAWMAAVDAAPYELREHTRRIAEFYRVASLIWLKPDPSTLPDLERLLRYFVDENDTFAEVFIRMSIALLQLQLTPPRADEAEKNLERAQEIAGERQSQFLMATALLIRGQVAIIRGDLHTAVELYERSLKASASGGDVLNQSAALYGLAWVRILTRDPDAARDLLVRHLLISSSMNHEEGIALGLEGLFSVAVMTGDAQQAGRYLGAAESIRARKGITGPTIFSYHQPFLAQVEASPAADEFDEARQRGRDAETADVLEEALR